MMRDDEENQDRLNTDPDHKDEDPDAAALRRRREEAKQAANEDQIMDDQNFIKLMGTERYIDFAEYAKIMSLFNPRT